MIAVAAKAVTNNVEVRSAFDRAIRRGLLAAGAVVLAHVRKKLSRKGYPPPRKGGTKASAKRIERARKIFLGEAILRNRGSLIGGRSLTREQKQYVRAAIKRRNLVAAQEYVAGGLIDPPGGSPRLRSGQLRQSMVMEQSDAETVRVGSDMAMGPGSKGYAAAQEFGTKTIPARPYLRPALREAEAEAMLAFQRAAQEALR